MFYQVLDHEMSVVFFYLKYFGQKYLKKNKKRPVGRFFCSKG
jgi:hypothetical protein